MNPASSSRYQALILNRWSRDPSLARLARLPGRIHRDTKAILLLRNWREFLAAEVTGDSLKRLQFRNGLLLTAPVNASLAFLFDEIWIREVYNPPGYKLQVGDVVVDIGANIGVYSTYAATRASPIKVHAYEPFPDSIAWLRQNIADSRLTNIQTYQRAVAASAGERTLVVDCSEWGLSSFYRNSDHKQQVSVKCTTLDIVLDEVGRCDLLKLDCEGSEYEILQGCSPETLSRVKRIVGEYHEWPGIKGTGQELCRLLESCSFRIDRFEAFGIGSGLFCATNTTA